MDYTKDLLVILHKVKATLPVDETVSKSMSSLLNTFEKVTCFFMSKGLLNDLR